MYMINMDTTPYFFFYYVSNLIGRKFFFLHIWVIFVYSFLYNMNTQANTYN